MITTEDLEQNVKEVEQLIQQKQALIQQEVAQLNAARGALMQLHNLLKVSNGRKPEPDDEAKT